MHKNIEELQKNNATDDKWDIIMANILLISLIIGSVIAVIAVGGMAN